MTELSPELQSELVAFVRTLATEPSLQNCQVRWTAARDLAAKLPPPVDPDIEEARGRNALIEQLREAIQREADRQPTTWDWYDLARAAADEAILRRELERSGK